MDKLDTVINFAIDSIKNRYTNRLVHYSCIDEIVIDAWSAFSNKSDGDKEYWNVQYIKDVVNADLAYAGYQINYSDIKETV